MKYVFDKSRSPYNIGIFEQIEQGSNPSHWVKCVSFAAHNLSRFNIIMMRPIIHFQNKMLCSPIDMTPPKHSRNVDFRDENSYLGSGGENRKSPEELTLYEATPGDFNGQQVRQSCVRGFCFTLFTGTTQYGGAGGRVVE